MELTKKQKEVLEEINNRLQRGDIKAIAETTGFTRERVGSCLSPNADFYNVKIVDAAVKLLAQRDADVTVHLETLTAA